MKILKIPFHAMKSNKSNYSKRFNYRYLYLFLLLVFTSCKTSINELTSNGDSNEMLMMNGKIFTGDRNNPYAEAVLVRDKRIVAVGSLNEVKSKAQDPETVDLGGRLLVPGLVDTHVHAFFAGYATLAAELPFQVLPPAQLSSFAEQARTSGQGLVGDVLRIGNANLDYWNDLSVLDNIFNNPPFENIPVIIAGMDAHTGWSNRTMLARAGIDQNYIGSLSQEQRRFYGFDAQLNPNGYTVDDGWDYVLANVPPVPAGTLLEAGRAAIRTLNSYGITAWLDPMGNGRPVAPLFSWRPTQNDEGLLPTYRSLSQSGELTGRVAAMVLLHARSEPAELSVVEALRQRYANVPNLTIPGIKILGDGVLEYPAQTAAISIPYINSGSLGALGFEPAQFARLVTAADARGLIVHTHAIGDRAVRETLNAIEAARQSNGPSGPSHTIVHLQIVNPSDRPRFKQLNVLAGMQLLWKEPGLESNELLQPYVNPGLLTNMYSGRRLLDAGATLVSGSDWPVSTPNPFASIAMIANNPASEVVTPEEMLYSFTSDAARALGMEDRVGRIAPGRLADMALLDRDLTVIPAGEIESTRVLWTMFDGRFVYRTE
ncbi:amidohydrolase [Chryseobacterium piperi]|uniref:amidohydrolase n=1 Tax=Chryseobacterium piperi TaxID=558152 RepID=UPI00068C0DE7|nr:amidohydrolase [Chryseobacterium piperi]ASW73963.1 amidohydrolase [Chryseobacterium piperi]